MGHLQRGGSPSAFDRIVAGRLGMGAINAIKSGKFNVIVGIIKNELHYSPINSVVKESNSIQNEIININSVISR